MAAEGLRVTVSMRGLTAFYICVFRASKRRKRKQQRRGAWVTVAGRPSDCIFAMLRRATRSIVKMGSVLGDFLDLSLVRRERERERASMRSSPCGPRGLAEGPSSLLGCSVALSPPK